MSRLLMISLAWLAAIPMLAGCATYERQPLELAQYAQVWPGRSLTADSIRECAITLSADEENPPYDPSDGLSLSEAEAVALVFNPQLRLARSQAEVPLASARESGWWPDPEFEAEVVRFANRGTRGTFSFDGPSFSGINTGILGPTGLSANGIEASPPGFRKTEGDFVEDPWIVGTSLSITIPISGRLAVEQDWAWAQYRSSWRCILIAEWELLTHLRSSWMEWSTTVKQIEAIEELIVQLQEAATITEQLAAAGEVRLTDSRLLLVELQWRRTSLLELMAEEELQRLGLLATLGLAPETPIQLQPQVILPSTDELLDTPRDAIVSRDPRVLSVQADYEVAEQRLRLEVRKQYPDLNVGPGYSFEEGLSRLGMGFGFSLPLWNHNRQAVSEATAERNATRTLAQTRIEQVFSEFAKAQTRLRYSQQRRRALLDQVVPLVDLQIEETRKLLELGEVDALVLREVLSSAVETKLELLDATLKEAQAANALKQMLEPRWITPSQDKLEETAK